MNSNTIQSPGRVISSKVTIDNQQTFQLKQDSAQKEEVYTNDYLEHEEKSLKYDLPSQDRHTIDDAEVSKPEIEDDEVAEDLGQGEDTPPVPESTAQDVQAANMRDQPSKPSSVPAGAKRPQINTGTVNTY